MTLADKSELIKNLESKWSEFRISGQCGKYPLADRATWLHDQLQQHKSRQQQLSEQIQSYGKQKEQLELYKSDLTALDKELTDYENRIKDNERALKSLLEQQQNNTTAQRKAIHNLESVQSAVAIYFRAEEWFKNWQHNPDAFVQQIREFGCNWKNNTTRLEEQLHHQKMTVEKIKEWESRLKDVEEDSRKKGEYLADLQSRHKELTDQREAIFNGVPAEEMEVKLKETTRVAKQVLEEQKKKVDAILSEITRLEALHGQLEKDVATLIRQETTVDEQIEDWIVHYNRQYNAVPETSAPSQSEDACHTPQHSLYTSPQYPLHTSLQHPPYTSPQHPLHTSSQHPPYASRQASVLSREQLLPLLEFTREWIENERRELQEIDTAVMPSQFWENVPRR